MSIASHGSRTVESVVALDRVRHAAVRPAVLIRTLAAGGLYQGVSSARACPAAATAPLTMVMTPDQTALLVVQKAATNIWQALTGKHAPAAAAVLADAPRHRRRLHAGRRLLMHDPSGRATMALGTAGLGALLGQWLRRRTHP